MKNRSLNIILFLLLSIIIATISCNSGGNKTAVGVVPAPSSSDTAHIAFTEYEHDFGKVDEGENVAYTFSFENKGNAPLVISQATTTCGCTVSKYSRKPVPPGGRGTIEVIFDSSGRNGKNTKVITVRSNATRPLVVIRIIAEVINTNNN